MSAMEGQERRADAVSGLLERLHNPTELRIFLMAVVLGIGYVAIYLPLDTTIATTTRKLEDGRRRLRLADEVEVLQKQYQQIESRIPKNPDASEWMQYILNRVRQSPVKLESFNPGLPQAMGSYQVINFKLKISGALPDVDAFLSWLELNPRLIRVDTIRLGGGGNKAEAGDISMEISIVGVMG